MSHSWNDAHMIGTGKSLLKALFATLGVFLALFVSTHIGGALYVSSIAASSADAFRSGIERDLTYLKEQGDAVAREELVQQYLTEENSEKLIETLRAEKEKRSIGLMGAATSEGVIIGRTRTVGKRGDNVFLTTPMGRIVAEGKSAQSVEAPIGFDPRQIFLTTGRPIMQSDRMIGALFANYLTDDIYAARFRDTYLAHGVEVVFYNRNGGVYGSSFSDGEVRKRINSYFNSGSEWIRNGSSGKTISFKDGTFYLVENIIFPGLEESPGGALLFIPRYDISSIANVVTAFVTLLVFVFFALSLHLRARRNGEERGWRYYTLLFSVSIPVLALAFFALHLQSIGYSRLERIPYTLYNSTMRLQPESGVYDLGFEQRFSIIVDTGDEAINAVQVGLIFDPKEIKVKALETATSTCSYAIENIVDTAAGRVKFSCILLKTGGERGSLTVADVVVEPQRTGTFTLAFDSEMTKVLASDGLGTDVLRASQASTYRVDTFNASLKDASATSTGRSFVVFSPTHPNEARWYREKTVRFVWRGNPGAVYSYAFDTSPDTIPSKKYTTQGNAIDLAIPGDGIYYFHLQLIPGGPIVHYRVRSDKTPPSIISTHLSSNKIIAGDVVRVSFEAQDLSSGVQRNYYVDLGNHLFLPVGSELFIPFLQAGEQKILLRIYDEAGNYAEKTQVVQVADSP